MFGLVTESTYNKALKTITDLAGMAAPGVNTALYGMLNNKMPVFDWDDKSGYITKGYQGNGDMYSIVDYGISKLAMCPVLQYELKPENVNKFMQYKAWKMSPSLDHQIKARSFELKSFSEIQHDDISQLFYQPNPLQTYYEWFSQYCGFLMITGNGYNYYNGLMGDQSKKWTEMFALPSSVMNIISGGAFKPVSGYNVIGSKNYNLYRPDFSCKEVSHLKKFNPNFTSIGSQLYGQAPGMAYKKTLQRDEDARDELHKQLKNGGTMGIFSPESGAPQIPPEVKQDIKKQLGDARTSRELASRIIVAMAAGKWQQIGLPSTDLQLIESLDLNTKDWCKAYHYPIQLMADTNASTDNNMGWAQKQAVYNFLMPWGFMMSDRLTRDICPGYQKGNNRIVLMYDYSTLPEMAEDNDKISSALSKSYFLTPNEKREAMGYGKYNGSGSENADTILVPNNLSRIDDILMTDNNFTDAGKGATEL